MPKKKSFGKDIDKIVEVIGIVIVAGVIGYILWSLFLPNNPTVNPTSVTTTSWGFSWESILFGVVVAIIVFIVIWFLFFRESDAE